MGLQYQKGGILYEKEVFCRGRLSRGVRIVDCPCQSCAMLAGMTEKTGIRDGMIKSADDFKPMTAWEHVERARDKKRPVGHHYIERLFPDFIELHGDRYLRDDPAVIGGIATFEGVPVTVIAQEKGEGTKDCIARNFGMVSPDGYRKSMRLLEQAQKFGRPHLTLYGIISGMFLMALALAFL